MSEQVERPEDSEIYTIEVAHDYEQSCAMLRQQIRLYLLQWRDLFDNDGLIEREYTKKSSVEDQSSKISARSPRVDSIDLSVDIVQSGTGVAKYELDGDGPLKSTFDVGDKQVVIMDAQQDESEYSRLYDLMQNMQACITLERQRRSNEPSTVTA